MRLAVYTNTKKNSVQSLHTKAFPQTFLHTKALTQRGFHTKKTFTQMLLHTNFRTNDVTQKGFFETGDLHKNLHRNFLMQELLHTGDFTRKLFNANAFTPKKPLHTGDFTRLKPGGEGKLAGQAQFFLIRQGGMFNMPPAWAGKQLRRNRFLCFTLSSGKQHRSGRPEPRIRRTPSV
jgi:hypothetical protein